MRHDKYRRDGTPYPEGHDGLMEWARDFEDFAGRIVEQTQVGDVKVSTVWLGLDPPLIFETMVFGGPLDQEQARYSTEAEARAGHEAMVTRVRETHGD